MMIANMNLTLSVPAVIYGNR